jgi:hypothetical protein
MRTEYVPLIVCGVIAFVLLLNAGLVLGILRGGNRERLKVIRKAINAVQNPWRAEDEQYDQLRTRVKELEDKDLEERPDGH